MTTEMKIEDQPLPETAAASVPATVAPGGAMAPASALQNLNNEFEGIDLSLFPQRVVLDGTDILYKDTDKAVSELRIRLQGGRAVHQYFDEDTNSYHKSYDGKYTEDGEPISKFPKMRLMFELDWEELVDGDMKKHQMVLSPTGRYAFVEYSQKLAKMNPPLRVSQVETIITATRQSNKEGQRYSKPQFTCQELIDKGL